MATSLALFVAAASLLLSAADAKPTGAAGGSKVCAHTGFYSKKVVPLCEKHFPEESSKHTWVVQFYHGRVQKVFEQRQAFEELAAGASKLDGAKVGAVDCEQNNDFCAKHGVRAAPTTRVIIHGNVREFDGEHTFGKLSSFVTDAQKSIVELEAALQCSVKGLFTDQKKDSALPLCSANIPPAVDQTPWLVTFYETGEHNKDKTMRSVLNKLGDKYGNCPPKKECTKKKPRRVRVGAVSCGSSAVDCEALGITSFPTVRFYRQGAEPQTYDSFFDREEVQQWTDARLKEMPKVEKAQAMVADMPETEAPKEEL